VAGQPYLLTYDVVSGAGNLQINVSGAATILDVFGSTSPGTKRAVAIADSAATSISANVYSAATVVLDNISLKPLTPEALA
jgi:hypothetical protein